jgi:ribose 5-phosphate isomerase B
VKIGLGSDHGGYELKEKIKEHLSDKGIEVVDYGTYSCESVDYPDFGEKAAKGVIAGECDRAIVSCGTGIGISIAANKVQGIRCALCAETYSARMAMEHNNSNMLSIGARVTGIDLALEIVDTWINSKFEGGRHERRVNKITEIERV